MCWTLYASAESTTSLNPRGVKHVFSDRGLESEYHHHEPRDEVVCGDNHRSYHRRLSRLLEDLHNSHKTHWLVAFNYFADVASTTEDQKGLPLCDYEENMFLKTNTLLKTRDIFLIRRKIN